MMAASNFDPRKRDDPEGEPAPRKYNPESKGTSSESASLLAQVTTLAWNLVIPIVGGVMLGAYIDERYSSGNTWTLSLLVLGVIIAFSNLYNLYVEHGRRFIDKDDKAETDEENRD